MVGTPGYNLRMLRFSRNLTQSQVAEYIGITYYTLSRYENDKIDKPRSSILVKLADFYNVPIKEIMKL